MERSQGPGMDCDGQRGCPRARVWARERASEEAYAMGGGRSTTDGADMKPQPVPHPQAPQPASPLHRSLRPPLSFTLRTLRGLREGHCNSAVTSVRKTCKDLKWTESSSHSTHGASSVPAGQWSRPRDSRPQGDPCTASRMPRRAARPPVNPPAALLPACVVL